MTANSSLPLAAGDLSRLMWLPAKFREPAQVWVLDIVHFTSVPTYLLTLSTRSTSDKNASLRWPRFF